MPIERCAGPPPADSQPVSAAPLTTETRRHQESRISVTLAHERTLAARPHQASAEISFHRTKSVGGRKRYHVSAPPVRSGQSRQERRAKQPQACIDSDATTARSESPVRALTPPLLTRPPSAPRRIFRAVRPNHFSRAFDRPTPTSRPSSPPPSSGLSRSCPAAANTHLAPALGPGQLSYCQSLPRLRVCVLDLSSTAW